MRIVPLLLLALFCTAATAQKTYPLQPEEDMLLEGTLTVDSSLGIARLFRPSKPHSIAVINSEAVIIKEFEFKLSDRVTALGKWKNLPVALYWTNSSDGDTGHHRQLRARFFDIPGLKVADDKPVFTNKENALLKLMVNYDSRQHITGVILWECKVKNENIFSNYNAGDYQTCTRLISVQMDASFSPVVKELTASKALNKYLMGICTGTDNACYLVSYSQTGITTEKFDKTGTFAGSLTHPFQHAFKSASIEPRFITTVDSISGNPLVALKYFGPHNTPVNMLVQFDFPQQKTTALIEDLLDKEYKNKLKEENRKKKFIKVNFFNAEFLEPSKIECTRDYIILLRNTREDYSMARYTNYYGYFGLVSVFDRKQNLQIKHTTVLDRYLRSDGSGREMYCHMVGKNLYTLASQWNGPSPYQKICFVMDPETGEVTRTELEKFNKMTEAGIQAQNTLWLGSTFIITNIINRTKLFGSVNIHTLLQKAAY